MYESLKPVGSGLKAVWSLRQIKSCFQQSLYAGEIWLTIRDSLEARGREAYKRKGNTCKGRFDKAFYTKYVSMPVLLGVI